MRSRRKVRIRQYEKDDVPQSRGDDCSARQSALNPAILEKTLDGEILRYRRPAEKNSQITAYPLLEASPRNIQLRRAARGQAHRSAHHARGLSRTGEGIKACQRHIPFDSEAAPCRCLLRQAKQPKKLLRYPAKSEKAFSAWAGLRSTVVFAGSCGSAAVEAQSRITLFENAVALQCAHLFRQIEVAVVFRDHHAAGPEKIPRTQKF